MAQFNGRKYTTHRGVDLGKDGNKPGAGGAIRFAALTTSPTTTTGELLLYVDANGLLKYDDGVSATTLGAAGAVQNFSLNDAYDDGNGITVDSSAVLLAGSHATNNVLELTGSAAVTGALIDLTQSGSGVDIDGTSSSWSVTKLGAGAFLSLATNTITGSSTNPSNLTIDATGTGTITIGGTSTGAVTITPALTATASVTITGTADSNVLTITAGDMLMSNGKIAITNDDTDSALTITAAAVTTGNVISATAVGITTGSILYLSTTEAGITSGNGSYIECYDSTAGATQFLVSDDGATTITGDAVGTSALTLTAGDITVSDGNFALTSTSTADVFSITDDSLLANNALIVKGSGAFTGTGASSFVAITPTGATTGTGLYVALANATTASKAVDVTTSTTTGQALVLTNTGVLTGVGAALSVVADAATTAGNSAGEGVVNISADGLTTGAALNVESLSNEVMTSGHLADFAHSAVGTTVAAKTGAVVRVTSSITESGTSTQDYDVLSLTRTSIHDTAGTLTAQGSILYLENVATETGATLTDTVNGLELVMDAQGTGDGVKITHPATAGRSINVISAATSVSSVLITGSGVKADNKADLEVTNSGATAAGGSILRVTNTGTPAAATSYLVDFDYSGATMTNNPVTVFVNSGASTAPALQINSAAAAASGHLEIASTNTGAVGPVIKLTHTSTGSAAANDVVGRILVDGLDNADAAESYARIDVIAQDVTAANPDSSLNFLVDRAGTLTLGLTVGWDDTAGAALNGIAVGDGAGAAIVSSNGAQNLTLNTNGGTNSGTITITQGANAAITLTPNGSGIIDLAGKIVTSETTTSSGAGAISITGAIHEITSTGVGDAMTLADGTEGQHLIIIHATDGGSAIVTPTNLAGGTTLTFTAAGDTAHLIFTAGEWYALSLSGPTPTAIA